MTCRVFLKVVGWVRLTLYRFKMANSVGNRYLLTYLPGQSDFVTDLGHIYNRIFITNPGLDPKVIKKATNVSKPV